MINESMYSKQSMRRLERQPQSATRGPPNPQEPAPPDPLLGAEARLKYDEADPKRPPDGANEQRVPASYVHTLAKRLLQLERDLKHLIHSSFGQDATEYPSVAQRLQQLETDSKAIAEMASQACSTSNRNYRDLTNLQEGKALRDSSGLLMLTFERVQKCERDIHDICGRLDILERALDYCVPNSRCITNYSKAVARTAEEAMRSQHLQALAAGRQNGKTVAIANLQAAQMRDPDFREVPAGNPYRVGTPESDAWQREQNQKADAACDQLAMGTERVLIGVDQGRGRDVGGMVTATVKGNDTVSIDRIQY